MSKATYEFDLLVFIGRMEPPHAGHCSIVQNALARARHVLVLMGSAEAAPTASNPWSAAERSHMLESVFPKEAAAGRLFCEGIPDRPYQNGAWAGLVHDAVYRALTTRLNGPASLRVGLIGHTKDESSYYLKWFPSWDYVEVPNFKGINATDIRKALFETGNIPDSLPVPSSVRAFIQAWTETDEYPRLKAEYHYLKAYRASFAMLPYPPVFVTVDTVVIQAGHLLLVQRNQDVGLGLWALPGGFLDAGERLEAAALRELKEETGVALDTLTPGASAVFDAPSRSQRGRIITHAFFFDLPGGDLPRAQVQNPTEIRNTQWVPLWQVAQMQSQLFEDHWWIIQRFLRERIATATRPVTPAA